MPRIKNKSVKKNITKKIKVKKEKTNKKSVVKEKVQNPTVLQLNKKNKKSPQLVRGMKDIVPPNSSDWVKMYRTADAITEAYNFSFFESPILEEAVLFARTLGKSSDVVSKEMYVFEDRDGNKLALRPEATASAARSYLTSGMVNMSQPVKLWYYGPMFRHDRPQAGRYRQFHQFGCESFGVHDASLDAEVITVAYNFIKDLGIETTVHINSIGTPEERAKYIVELVGYLRSKRSYLSEESKKRITKNPLRVLDSKEQQDIEAMEDAPQIVDWLSENSKQYFMNVLEYLDEVEVPYVLKPTLVRGLDYYTDTVFEIFADSNEPLASQGALGAGGRYDLLVEELGGQPTPGVGFSIGLERVLLEIKSKREKEKQNLEEGQKMSIKKGKKELFFAHLGEPSRKRTLALIEELRRAGITVRHCLGKVSLKGQLELADKFQVTHSIILGQKELQDGTIIIRDMESGIQEIVDQKKIKKEVSKILGIAY